MLWLHYYFVLPISVTFQWTDRCDKYLIFMLHHALEHLLLGDVVNRWMEMCVGLMYRQFVLTVDIYTLQFGKIWRILEINERRTMEYQIDASKWCFNCFRIANIGDNRHDWYCFSMSCARGEQKNQKFKNQFKIHEKNIEKIKSGNRSTATTTNQSTNNNNNKIDSARARGHLSQQQSNVATYKILQLCRF